MWQIIEFVEIVAKCLLCQMTRISSEIGLMGLSEEKTLEVMRLMLKYYSEADQDGALAGTNARKLLRELTGVDDPYVELKRNMNDYVAGLMPEMHELLDTVEGNYNRFEAACRASIIGNLLEFFMIDHSFSKKKQDLLKLWNEEKIQENDLPAAYEVIKKAKNILFLTDNAGEIFFDKILIQEIKAQFPKIRITLCSQQIILKLNFVLLQR